MASVTYVGKVLSDGHLSLPKKAREELKLEPGQEVGIVVRTRDEAPRLPSEAYTPLRKLIGLGKTGKPDAAAHHDKYLYGKEEV
jgi:bifunctional DNA-binding transcriptional regulator/antitoxin component of YhaV-PrlF toxin-antitoxin module